MLGKNLEALLYLLISHPYQLFNGSFTCLLMQFLLPNSNFSFVFQCWNGMFWCTEKGLMLLHFKTSHWPIAIWTTFTCFLQIRIWYSSVHDKCKTLQYCVNNIHEIIIWFWLAESSAVQVQRSAKKCNTSVKSVIPVLFQMMMGWKTKGNFVKWWQN